jgi:GTP cyclohydrolase II
MPEVIHWLGIKKIDRFVSMSNMKFDALDAGGIEVGERVPIPDELVPPDASVEMEAKKAAGYFAKETGVMKADKLKHVKGRSLHE